MSKRSAEVADAARRIEGWLLDSSVQLGEGPHRGGVAGWLEADGCPEFVYLEITGYYLTLLAWLATGSAGSEARAAQALEHGQAGLDWMRAVTADGAVPPTRLYLTPDEDDWRNRAVFSFDLAMAVRGADCFGTVASAADAATPVRELSHRLEAICSNTVPLASHTALEAPGAALPERWSTCPGPHHVKAAAALLRLPDGVVDADLVAACRATVDHWTAAMHEDWPCQELHPLLYGLEGLLMLGLFDAAEPIYERLLDLQAGDDTLPAAVTGSGGVRADVLAQALRAGELLRATGRLRGDVWRSRLEGLAGVLLGHVRPDGGVLFALDQQRANAWCAMFAHQALTLHASPGEDGLAARAAHLLV